jgi:hypothetical protein
VINYYNNTLDLHSKGGIPERFDAFWSTDSASRFVFETPGRNGNEGTVSVRKVGTDIYLHEMGYRIEARHVDDITDWGKATFMLLNEFLGGLPSNELVISPFDDDTYVWIIDESTTIASGYGLALDAYNEDAHMYIKVPEIGEWIKII